MVISNVKTGDVDFHCPHNGHGASYLLKNCIVASPTTFGRLTISRRAQVYGAVSPAPSVFVTFVSALMLVNSLLLVTSLT